MLTRVVLRKLSNTFLKFDRIINLTILLKFMKNYIHKIATYMALILVSAIPFSLEAIDEIEKKQNSIISGVSLKMLKQKNTKFD